METHTLMTLIRGSRLLTADEKRYWEQSLPHMTPEQLTRLEGILERATTIPWTEKVQDYLGLIGRAAQSYMKSAS